MNETKTAYISCEKISDGCFNGEKSVVLKDFTGVQTSGFFEDKYIKNNKLQVKVLDIKEGFALINLPGKCLEGIGDKGYMTINQTELSYAA